jgi:hypothetical protein
MQQMRHPPGFVSRSSSRAVAMFIARQRPNRSFPRTRESSFFITTGSLLKAGSPRARGRAGWGRGVLCLAAALAAGHSAFAAEWRELAPPDLGFAIEIPGDAVYADENGSPHVLAARHDYIFGTDVSEPLYIVTVFRLRPKVRAEMKDADAFTLGVSSIAPPCRPISEEPFPEGPGAAIEVVYRCYEDYRVRGRLHLSGDWIYRVTAGGPGGIADSADTYRYLDSFRVLAE